jgi:cell wall-active antibiotic response 4TMS protein YvqF
MRSRWEARGYAVGRLFGGVLLLSLGTIFILVNLGIVESRLVHTWWPLLLIGLGTAKLVGLRGWRRPRRPYSDFA